MLDFVVGFEQAVEDFERVEGADLGQADLVDDDEGYVVGVLLSELLLLFDGPEEDLFDSLGGGLQVALVVVRKHLLNFLKKLIVRLIPK